MTHRPRLNIQMNEGPLSTNGAPIPDCQGRRHSGHIDFDDVGSAYEGANRHS